MRSGLQTTKPQTACSSINTGRHINSLDGGGGAMTRRDFLTTAAAPLAAQTASRRFTFCFFSKHLPGLKVAAFGEGIVNWPQMLPLIAGAGFCGPISIHPAYKPTPPTAAAPAP